MRRDLAPVRLLYGFMERFLLPLLKRWGVTPAGLTSAGLVFSIMAALAYLISPVLAGILALIGGLCDTADGFWARKSGTASLKGAFLDSVLDRYAEFCLLIGVWAYLSHFPGYAGIGTLTVFLALVGSFMVSYTRARGESLAVSFKGGVFTREERLLTLVAGSLADPLAPGLILLLTAAVLAVGANLTAIYRFRCIINRLPVSDLPASPTEPD